MLPEVYLHLKEILSKTRATSLPPHHPYYCAIDLLPGTPPPKGQLYSPSGPKRKTMDKYIHGAHSGIICPSSSLAGPLWPCIDYHGLKSIMVKNRDHLPLISLGVAEGRKGPASSPSSTFSIICSGSGGGKLEDGVQDSQQPL